MTRRTYFVVCVLVGCGSERGDNAAKLKQVDTRHAQVAGGWQVAMNLDDAGRPAHMQLVNDDVGRGHVMSWREGKLVALGSTKEGDLDGVLHNYYDSGAVMAESWYVKGKLQGPSRQWWESGRLRRAGEYVDDWPVGEWTEWFPSGEVRAVMRYHPPSDKLILKVSPWYLRRRCAPNEPFVEEIRDGERAPGVGACPE